MTRRVVLWKEILSLATTDLKINQRRSCWSDCLRRTVASQWRKFPKPCSMICLQTPSFGWSFHDGRQLASKPAHHKPRVARSSPIFQISACNTPNLSMDFWTGSNWGCVINLANDKHRANYLCRSELLISLKFLHVKQVDRSRLCLGVAQQWWNGFYSL